MVTVGDVETKELVIRSEKPPFLRSAVANLLWVGAIYLNFAVGFALLLFCRSLTTAFLVLAALVFLALVPINERSRIGRYLASIVGR